MPPAMKALRVGGGYVSLGTLPRGRTRGLRVGGFHVLSGRNGRINTEEEEGGKLTLLLLTL